MPRLGYDVAYHWMLEGFFGDALRLAQALQPHFQAPAERALVLGLVARSAGGAGDREAFARARADVEGLLAGAGEDSAARALLGVAYGAASLDEWKVAQEYATRALTWPRSAGRAGWCWPRRPRWSPCPRASAPRRHPASVRHPSGGRVR